MTVQTFASQPRIWAGCSVMAVCVAFSVSRPRPAQEPTVDGELVTPVQISASSRQMRPPQDMFEALKIAVNPERSKPIWMAILPEGASAFESSSSDDNVQVHTVRGNGTAVVMVMNRRQNTGGVRVTTQLGAGLFTAERFLVNINSAEDIPACQRLETVANSKPGEVVRSFKLAPNHLLILRFTNRSDSAARALQRVQNLLQKASTSAPSEFRRLRIPWSDAKDDLISVTSSSAVSRRNSTARTIHQRMLELTHLQAMCRNAVNNGVFGETGKELMSAVTQLDRSLGELSACALNLLPTLEWDADQKRLRVKITNAGGASVSRVRIGIAAPEGAKVVPSEDAAFPGLGAGQTVRSDVTVELPQNNPQTLGADVSFFLGNRPARLRVGIL